MKLKIGKDIILDRNEKLFTYRNKINGTIYYSTSRYEPIYRDGQEFIAVFEKPSSPLHRRVNLMASSALERVKVV